MQRIYGNTVLGVIFTVRLKIEDLDQSLQCFLLRCFLHCYYNIATDEVLFTLSRNTVHMVDLSSTAEDSDPTKIS